MGTELPSLAKIFNNRLFRIPDYQRGFAWGERQLADFWSDLLRVELDRTHYCGQLTLEKAPEENWQQWTGDTWLMEDAGYDAHFVVDGQQRLTTAVILLQCLLEGLPEDQLLAGQSVKETAPALSGKIQRSVGESSLRVRTGQPQPRILLHTNSRDSLKRVSWCPHGLHR